MDRDQITGNVIAIVFLVSVGLISSYLFWVQFKNGS